MSNNNKFLSRSHIIGTGIYVPETSWDNHVFEKMFDTSDEWITTRTGIRNRYIAANDETTSTLASRAAEKALKEGNVKPEDVDMIILATMTPDMIFPSTACRVQKLIGASNAFAFDIMAACSGYLYALSVADLFLKSGKMKYVLVIGAETMSRFLDWEDRKTCILFGDGAGATLLSSASSDSGIIDTYLKSNGEYFDLLFIPAGGSQEPSSTDTVRERKHYIKMSGKGLFREATAAMEQSVRIILNKNQYTLDDVDLLIPHQANLRILAATARRLKLPMEKVYVNLDRYGNTSAASIPIALSEALDNGNINSGDLVAFTAFGGGMTWGSALIRF